MFRTLTDYSRSMLQSPWLMLFGIVVLVVPGGLLLMPVLASRLRRAKTDLPGEDTSFAEPNVTTDVCDSESSASNSDVISLVPSPSVGALK